MKCRVAAFAFVLSQVFSVRANPNPPEKRTTEAHLGTVRFSVSCSAALHKPFERGVALLHSFSYDGAEMEFERIAKDDPGCAMAHWGIAMSLWHQIWNQPDAATSKKGIAELEKAKSLHPRTQRERDYIVALDSFYANSDKRKYKARVNAYSQSMEQLHNSYPDDHEATAFYALSLLASEPEHDVTHANRKKAANVLEKLFAVEPNHPGAAHYLIHCYDDPEVAELGLPAARAFSVIAPAAPHALHMPSHIFARLGLWKDDISSNLASVSAARKNAATHMGDEGQQFHAMDFLVYAYLQSGRESEAERLIQEVKAMPDVKDMYGMGFDPRISALISFSAVYSLELHHWDEAASLTPISAKGFADESITHWARAIGASRNGNPGEARQEIGQIERIHAAMVAEKKVGSAEAVERDREEASAWLAHAEGRDADALTTLRSIAQKEQGFSAAGDGIPAHEMLADILLELGRPKEALEEYRADLHLNPNRFNGLYGAANAAELAGNLEEATAYYTELVKVCAGGNSDRVELNQARAWTAMKQE